MSTFRRSLPWMAAATCFVLTGSCRDARDPLAPSSPEFAAKKKPAPDAQAPTLPAFSVTEVGPTHVALAWSSTDASTPILYRVELNGALATYGFETAKTFAALQQSTTYTFRASARDAAGNWSAFSAPFTVTTTAADPNDLTPPSTPGGVWADLYGDGGREMQVQWTASSDNVTPQAALIYHIAVNGVVDNSAVGKTWSSVYGVAGDNVISVIAVDAAGNRSVAGTFNIHIPF